MLKKRPLFLLSVLLFLTGCKSLPYYELQEDFQNPNLLSRMDIWVDIPSVEDAFGASSWSADGTVKPDSPYGKGVIVVTPTSRVYTAESRVQDVVTVFTGDVSNNIMDVAKPRRGNIVLRLIEPSVKNNYRWSWLSGATLGIPNALGMPMCSHRVTLNIQVEIYDGKNHLVAKYNEWGTDKEYMAAYWGYNFRDFRRRAAIRALQNGLGKIKENIVQDYGMIEAKLK